MYEGYLARLERGGGSVGRNIDAASRARTQLIDLFSGSGSGRAS
jgi:hypothetical protein